MQAKSECLISAENTDPTFIEEVLKMPGGKKILDCIRCGMCGGSCDVRFATDYSPMQIFAMCSLGMKDKVLSSMAVWTCASCYTCASRCPRGIEIPLVMSGLKNLAIKNNIDLGDNPKLKFHKGFYGVINKYGRSFELDIMMKLMKFNVKDPQVRKDLMKTAGLGIRMVKKNKIKMMPPRTKAKDQVKKMYQKAEGEKKA